MTTATINSNTPTRKIFEKSFIHIEIETAMTLEKFENDQRINGRANETIRTRLQALKQVAQQTNLNNPEDVKTWLSSEKCHWNNKTKTKFCDTYTTYLIFKGLTWNAPKYVIAQKLPFIPTEQEIDLLIAHCGKTTATVLQMLKETGMRIGELCQLKWIDINTQSKTVNITPEKHSNPRILRISDKLVAMLSKLPHQHKDNVFQPRKNILRDYYCRQRKEIAERLQNPRLLKISFHTFRHWKGTTEYHNTRDLRYVQKLLGHKSIVTTMIYENTENALFLNTQDDFICKVAHNEAEAIQLIETGFTYINNMGDNCALYRKRK